MKEIELQLNIHTPWSKYTETKIKDCECDISFYEKFMNTKHHFDCTDFCKIDIANDGKIFIRFLNEQSEKELREYTAILLYFISICNGYNCEYYEWAVIDNIFYPRFFNYAKEDDMGLPSYKKDMFYQISLQDIDDIFGKIISDLFAMNRKLIMMLLSNYYATIVYKDFINNGEYRFRNNGTVGNKVT